MRGQVRRRGSTSSFVIDVAPDPATGRRRLVLDPDTMQLLTEHRRTQDRDRALLSTTPSTTGRTTGLVPSEPDGGPIHPDGVTRRFKTFVRQSGLPELRGPHDLCHTWASLALAAGVHPKVVSDRLGHSTIAFYSHAIPSLDADAAATVASQLFTHDEEVDG